MSKIKTTQFRAEGSGRVSKARLFEYRDQWLTQEQKNGTTYFFRCWYEAEAGRVRRRALTGTRTREEAKQALIEAVLSTPSSDPEDMQNVYLASVLQHYLHAKKETGMRSMTAAERACALVLEFMKENGFAAPTVADYNLVWQEGFHEWCRDEKDLSAKSIATYSVYIAAALKMARTPRLVTDENGTRRQVRTVRETHPVETSEKKIASKLRMTVSKPRDFVPTIEEMAAFIDAIQEEHVFRFVVMELNTWARPEAVLQLNVAEQVNFRYGLINLNQEGRVQTNKRRPIIRLTPCLSGWLQFWNLDYPIVYQGKPCASVNYRSIKKVAKRAGISGQFVPYTFRHFMATKIRRVPNCPVSREERAQWLGHVDKDFTITERWYESFDPDYLEGAVNAIEGLMRMIDAHCKRRLFAPETHPKKTIYLAASA